MSHPGSRKIQSDIVLPTDFQQPARRAFFHGVRLATALMSRLHVLHVIKAPTDRSGLAADSHTLRSIRTSALLHLGRLVRMAREAGASVQPLLLYGDPISCIEETVTRTHAGLIVMGTEGRTGWDRLRIGSTAEALVRAAPCPVLTVHGGLAGDLVRHPARVRLRRLLVATDFSRSAAAALRTVSGWASNLGATIRLVHVCALSSDRRQAERQVSIQVQDLRRAGLQAEGHCLVGEPVEGILAHAGAWHPDLLAAGTQGRRGVHRLVLGSVAEELLKRAGCPVLTVGPPRRHGRRAVP